ncbi:MAG: response regulator transcription factor [Lachnospiraceae bacterium]|nr:response regulator transcription factor [Lachnospiraceae bacterium]
MNDKIIIVEDDILLNRALCKTFENAGYDAKGASSVREAQDYMKDGAALMVIDIGLPDGDGFALCRQVRADRDIPVIFLTARDEEADMLRGFDCGADDYLVKPFPMTVLLKHAQAVLRRTTDGGAGIFSYRELSIDFERKQVISGGSKVSLTPKEYSLLELLAKNRKRVITKQIMLEQLWDVQGSFVDENTVNVTLYRLRKKIEPDPSNPTYIKNVFGIGYTFGE